MEKIILVCVYSLLVGCYGQFDENDGNQFLEDYNRDASDMYTSNVVAAWNYYTNITNYNLDIMTQSNLDFSNFSETKANEAKNYNWQTFSNETTKRLFKKLTSIGFSAIPDKEKLKQISTLEAELTGIYSTGKVCLQEFGEGCFELEPGLTDIISTSRDYLKLLAVWQGFRDATGKKMRGMYTDFVNVMNEAIGYSGFNDTGEYWRSWYETDNFEEEVKRLFEELRPLYEQLHAYVRRKLIGVYGEEVFPKSGHIPAHILGNMWAQQWGNIYDLVEPYPEAESVDITSKMREQGYNITHMYRVAEDFFTSIGLDPMPESFWTNSMLEKPEDRNVVCHASAWDFYNGTDFRIKQCTSVTEDQFITVHHEMGHIVYYMYYDHLPILFRRGANPGFHEGVADIVSLSFQTPEHMKEIGLMDELPTDDKSDINFLLKMALDKLAFLPFGYLIDQWRWSVFRGATNTSNYNEEWWKLRCFYQGISPPVARSEDDFDPGAKYHIPGNTPYIRYFVSHVVLFQWHKALCDVAGNTRPLHRCDIYRNTDAGNHLRKMLEMGSSKVWTEAMREMTGEAQMSALPLIDYFRPLMDWLKEQNKEENVGWSQECPTNIFVPSRDVSGASLPMFSLVLSVVLILLSRYLN